MISKSKLFITAGIGAALECYDFMICAFMASTLITLFFPTESFLGLFSIFTIAFFSRPLGGIFWGHLGDRYGRKRVFSLTMLLLVFPTLGIALFPVHFVSAGVAASGFIILRFLQGFLVGGEFSGGVTFIAEIATSERRGATVASFMMALTIGTLLASLVTFVLHSIFSNAVILEWVWRIPFFISIILIIVAVYIRKKIQETPFFQSLTKRADISRFPVRDLFQNHFISVLKGFTLTCASAMSLVTWYLYFPQLFKNYSVFNTSNILFLTTLGTFLLCVAMPFAGMLADRFGRKIIFLTSMWLLTVALGLLYAALQCKSFALLTVTMIVASICFSGVNANYCVFLSELFPTRVRFSGVAVCYNFGYALCGGVLPLLYAHFSTSFGVLTLPILFSIAISFLCVFAVSKITEMHRKDLVD